MTDLNPRHKSLRETLSSLADNEVIEVDSDNDGMDGSDGSRDVDEAERVCEGTAGGEETDGSPGELVPSAAMGLKCRSTSCSLYT